VLFERFLGGFEGRTEQIFEGTTMLVGAALVTYAVLWVSGAAQGAALKQRTTIRLSGGAAFGIFFLVVLSVLREGVELVIFLAAARTASGGTVLPGVLLGLAAAALFGLLLSRFARSGLRAVFTVTTVLLVLFAAGLVSRGLGELSEAGLISPIVDPVWNIDGKLPALRDDGPLGGVLGSLFGYRAAPSALELIGWAGYMAAAGATALLRRTRK